MTWRLLVCLIIVYFNVLVINKNLIIGCINIYCKQNGIPLSAHFIVPHNVLCWPEDGRLRSKHVAEMWPECIYGNTVLIYSCVLTEYNTVYKFVTTRWDGLCQILLLVTERFYYVVPTYSICNNKVVWYTLTQLHCMIIYENIATCFGF